MGLDDHDSGTAVDDQVPTVLFKYLPKSLWTLLNLLNNSLYFGAPAKFNDPYDCALSPLIEEPSDVEVGASIGIVFPDLPTNPYLLSEVISEPPEKMRDRLTTSARKIVAEAAGHFVNSSGVSCFSEENSNILMWSHYASQHQGLCLEFQTKSLLFQKVKQVRYADVIPTIKAADVLAMERFERIEDLFRTKSCDWKYEREWRVIEPKVGKVCYSISDLKAIYFGARADARMISVVKKIVSRNGLEAQLFQGRLSATEFRINFAPIDFKAT